MDELKKLLCSRRGHKSHLSKILLSVDTILDRLTASPNATLEDSDTILLSEHCKQLRLKADTFTDLDEKIIQRTDDEEKLEAAVFESADLQAMLSEKLPSSLIHYRRLLAPAHNLNQIYLLQIPLNTVQMLRTKYQNSCQ